VCPANSRSERRVDFTFYPEFRIMMRILSIVLVTATAAMAALPQNPPAKNPPLLPQNPRPAAGTETKEAHPDAKVDDALLATWVLVSSNNVATLAQIAQQKASDPEVKKLAQKMADDHRQIAQRLQSFAGTAGKGNLGGVERPAGGKPEEASAPRSGGEFDNIALAQELGDECLQSARKELEAKSGAEFDRCYVGSVIGAHMGAKDMLTVFQRHASPTLKPVLMDAQQIVSSHLEHAKELAKSMEKPAGREPVGGK
jgi:predicted outer membrane protein